MLLVKTYVAPSSIDGLGLFADQFIPIGTIVRVTNTIVDKLITRSEYNELPEVVQEYINKYAWDDENGDLHLAFDNEIYTNHSTVPNLKLSRGTDEHIAIKNIEKGEEITDDYREYSHKDPSRPWLNE